MLRLAVSLLLAVPVLSNLDFSVKNEQTSPDKQCDPTAPGACSTFTKLSPTHNLDKKSATQYHTAGDPDFFAKVRVSVGTLTVGDPWKVGRFTLEQKKTIVMPKTFPFGNNKGIELRTIRLVTGQEKTHRWGPKSTAYDLEVVLVGRNLDQPDMYKEDTYVALSRVFAQKDTDIDPADGEFLTMMDSTRGTSFELELEKVFPQGQSITTYSGGNSEACNCDSDTTWVLFSAPGNPDSHVSKGLMDRIKGLGLSETAWRKYDEEETKDVVVVAHQFDKKCDKKWDEDCGDTCDCGGGAGDGAGNKGDSDDDCKKQPTPAHCISSAGTVEVCLAFTLLAAVPFF
jgi:hypothetical protein